MPPKQPQRRPRRRSTLVHDNAPPPTGVKLSVFRRTAPPEEEGGPGGVTACCFAMGNSSVFATVHRGGSVCLWLYPQCHMLRKIDTGAIPVAVALSDTGSACGVVLDSAELRVYGYSGEERARVDLSVACVLPCGSSGSPPPAGACRLGAVCFTSPTSPGPMLAAAAPAGQLCSVDWQAVGGMCSAVPIPADIGSVTALSGVLPLRRGKRGGGAWLGLAGTEKGAAVLLSAAAVLNVVPLAHRAAVRCAAVAPDGAAAATVAADGELLLWHLGRSALTPTRRLQCSAHGAAFSSDSRLLAVAEERAVRTARFAALVRSRGQDEREKEIGLVRTERHEATVELQAPCECVAWAPFAMDRQADLLKDPDFRASLIAGEGDGVVALECRDFDAMWISRPVLFFLVFLFLGAAFLTWLIP
eukprot:TRINITY_DN65082_c0_g1_i1.p1 TRINITY_DN65082_c0_g1~~TRINITY_DN65082_c0_g1_i1.p1  ORF type:complete len:416 (+),score=92.14 TRINITY_DN65082_c0_g1_i1:81-1328(+)